MSIAKQTQDGPSLSDDFEQSFQQSPSQQWSPSNMSPIMTRGYGKSRNKLGGPAQTI